MNWQHLPLSAMPSLMWAVLRKHWHLILGGTLGGSWQLRQTWANGRPGWSLLLLFLTLVVLLGAARWLSWRYRLEPETLHLRRGLWARTDSVLPLARVQGLQVHQSLLLRWFGLYEVTLESAGDARSHLHLPAINARQLLQLRRQIEQHSLAALPVGQTMAHTRAARADAEYRLSWPDLIRLSASSGQTLMIAPALIALAQRIGLEAEKKWWQSYLALLQQLSLPGELLLLGLTFLLSTALLLGLTLGWGVWRFGRYRLSTTPGLWHQQSGLVTHYAQSLNPARACAVIWRQNPLQYWFGRGWLHIVVQGQDGGTGEDIKSELGSQAEAAKHATTFRIPWLSVRQARHWQTRLFAGHPGMQHKAARHQPLSPLFLKLNRRKLIWLPLLVVGIVWLLCLWLGPVCQPWLASNMDRITVRYPDWLDSWQRWWPNRWQWLALGLGWLLAAEAGLRWRYRCWRFAVSASALRIARTDWACQRILLPWSTIQSVRLRQSPLERRWGIASLEFSCLFGKIRLPCLPLADAHALFNYAAARSAIPAESGMN
jgi:putative membrane protein